MLRAALLQILGDDRQLILNEKLLGFSRARIFKRLWSPGIDAKEWIPPAYVACTGIFKQSMGTRSRVGIGLSYTRPARAEIFNF